MNDLPLAATTPMEEVLRIRDAMFCEDMAVPDDLTSYSPADVRSYFESGGKPATRPMSPPPPELAHATFIDGGAGLPHLEAVQIDPVAVHNEKASPMVIRVADGLCNRLRVVLSSACVARALWF